MLSPGRILRVSTASFLPTSKRTAVHQLGLDRRPFGQALLTADDHLFGALYAVLDLHEAGSADTQLPLRRVAFPSATTQTTLEPCRGSTASSGITTASGRTAVASRASMNMPAWELPPRIGHPRLHHDSPPGQLHRRIDEVDLPGELPAGERGTRKSPAGQPSTDRRSAQGPGTRRVRRDRLERRQPSLGGDIIAQADEALTYDARERCPHQGASRRTWSLASWASLLRMDASARSSSACDEAFCPRSSRVRVSDWRARSRSA